MSGIDVDSLVAGFAFALVATFVAWWALLGITLLRRMLSDASDV